MPPEGFIGRLCRHCRGVFDTPRRHNGGYPDFCSEDCRIARRNLLSTLRKSGRKCGRMPGFEMLTEREYTSEELEFLKAMDRFRRESDCPFPTFREALAVARSLGYRKVKSDGP